jgi:hypothetical protein
MGYACSWGEKDNACIHSFEETLENIRLEDQDGEGMLTLRWILTVMGCEDGTGSGPCPIAGFGFSNVEPLFCVTTV